MWLARRLELQATRRRVTWGCGAEARGNASDTEGNGRRYTGDVTTQHIGTKRRGRRHRRKARRATSETVRITDGGIGG